MSSTLWSVGSGKPLGAVGSADQEDSPQYMKPPEAARSTDDPAPSSTFLTRRTACSAGLGHWPPGAAGSTEDPAPSSASPTRRTACSTGLRHWPQEQRGLQRTQPPALHPPTTPSTPHWTHLRPTSRWDAASELLGGSEELGRGGNPRRAGSAL